MFKMETGSPDKETVIFLHGGGLDHTQWKEVMQHLSKDFHCVAVDLPMHGRSVHITLSMTAVMEEMEVLLKSYKKVHLVGLSLGGVIALTVLNRFPEYIQSVIVSGTVFSFPAKSAELINTYAAPIYGLLKSEWIASLLMKTSNIPSRFKEDINQAVKSTSVEQARAMYLLLAEGEAPDASPCPLLIVVGEKENRAVKRSQSSMLTSIKNSAAAIVPGVGHAWSYENPLLFAEMVDEWCRHRKIHHVLIGE
ncbi:MAG: alpha/beta fold hydrolase [Lysinibacillus sp.]